jgi:hypothetical protein
MSYRSIKIGDRVKVFISDEKSFWAEVKYIPGAIGDVWIFEDDTDCTYYVQMFQFIFSPKYA